MRRRQEKVLELRFEIERLAKRRDMMRCIVELSNANRNLERQNLDMLSSIAYVAENITRDTIISYETLHSLSLSLSLSLSIANKLLNRNTVIFARLEINLANS